MFLICAIVRVSSSESSRRLVQIFLAERVFPKYPPMSIERLERECTTDVYDPNYKLLTHLGVKMTELEDQMPYELKYWREDGYYDVDMMQFERVKAPPSVPI